MLRRCGFVSLESGVFAILSGTLATASRRLYELIGLWLTNLLNPALSIRRKNSTITTMPLVRLCRDDRCSRLQICLPNSQDALFLSFLGDFILRMRETASKSGDATAAIDLHLAALVKLMIPVWRDRTAYSHRRIRRAIVGDPSSRRPYFKLT